jgi:chromosome segregation ATPase
LPIFWSKDHEQRALHEAYQFGRSDGYEEGKRMGELEARAIIRDFMVKIRCDLSPEIEFDLPSFPLTLEDWNETAQEACKKLVAKIGTLRTEFAGYRRQFNPERVDQLDRQIGNLQMENKTIRGINASIGGERDDARKKLADAQVDVARVRSYAMSLERKINDQQAVIVDLQNKLDRAKNTGK